MCCIEIVSWNSNIDTLWVSNTYQILLGRLRPLCFAEITFTPVSNRKNKVVRISSSCVLKKMLSPYVQKTTEKDDTKEEKKIVKYPLPCRS